MYNPKTRPQFIQREWETRTLVGFIENVEEIKKALAELDAVRAEANKAEAEAKEAHKQADLRLLEANKRENEMVALMEANTKWKASVDAQAEVNAKLLKEFADKETLIALKEEELKNMEAEYHLLFNTAISKKLELDKREAIVVEAETRLAKKLAILAGE